MLVRRLAAIAFALAAFLAVPMAAHATYTAYTTGALNVRTGPGVSYHKIGVLSRGAPVYVHYCTGSWCNIAYGRGSAWVSGRYLSRAIVRPRPVYRPYIAPAYRYRGPGVSIWIGRPAPWW